MQPHDVDITINFHNGTQIQTKVDWKTIVLLKSKHKISAVEQAYNYTLLQTDKIDGKVKNERQNKANHNNA